MTRFIALFESVVQFVSESDEQLADKLQQAKADIAYLTDLYAKFNSLNKTLQGNGLNLVKVKSELCGFQNKLQLYKKTWRERSCFNFPVCYPSLKVILMMILRHTLPI